MQNPPKNKTILIVIVSIVSVLLGAGVYIFAFQEEIPEINTSFESELESLESDIMNPENSKTDSSLDSERKTDVNAVHAQVEAYHAKNGYYPTAANLSDSTWVASNLQGLDPDALIDPTTGAAYRYVPSPTSCNNTGGNLCATYVLSADLEVDGLGADDTDSDTDDYVERSLN